MPAMLQSKKNHDSLDEFWATNESMKTCFCGEVFMSMHVGKIVAFVFGKLRFERFGAGCDGASGGDTTAAIDGDIIISEFVIEFCRPSPCHPIQASAARHTTEA